MQGASAKVAVTGASGFIGQHLARRLASRGHEVHCLLRPSSITAAVAGGQGTNLHVLRGDMHDDGFLRRALDGCDVVYHSAAMVSDWGSIRAIHNANVTLTGRLVHAAAAADVKRFVHVSTTDVYGHPGQKNVTEEFSERPRHFNWYAETKRQAEAAVRAADLPHCIVRPATVYGPGSISLVGEFIHALKRGVGFTVNGGISDAGLVYVDDVVDAIELAGSHPAAEGESFNVCNNDEGIRWETFLSSLAGLLSCRYRTFNLPLSLAHFAGAACEFMYRYVLRYISAAMRPLLTRQAVQVLGIDQSFSYAKAQRLLGYRPAVSFADGLKRTIDAFEAQHDDTCRNRSL
jgi:nucleoside-diphosphate-sugar epimerase